MKNFGISYEWFGNTITIPHQDFIPKDLSVEADWSGASYWYEMVALAEKAEIRLFGLTQESLQGDAVVSKLFESLGVSSIFTENGVILSKSKRTCSFFEFDFINNPDLVQTLVVTLCLLSIPFHLSGADTLRVKETDRILALQNEMEKLGFAIREISPGVLEWDGKRHTPKKNVTIQTYKDHRIALAFAPVCLPFGKITIADAMVVTKSYPHFWEDLTAIGFHVTTESK